MRRTLTTVILALGALGCSDSLTPPNVPSSVSGAVVTAADVRAQIAALVPSGGLLNAANAQFDNVERSWSASPRRTDAARQQAAALCRFVSKLGSKLLDPNGASAPTSAEAVTTLCNSLNLYVDLSPSGVDVSGPNATAVFVPNGSPGDGPTLVLLPNKHAGVLIPQGAFGQDVTVIISPIPDAERPLAAAPGRQRPYFYEFQTVPVVPHFLQEVTVGVCTNEDVGHPAAMLRLAHNIQNNTRVEALPPVPVPFLDCELPITGVAQAPHIDRETFMDGRRLLATGAQAMRYVGSRAARYVLPTPAYATNISLGGASGSFSPFGGLIIGTNFEAYDDGTPTCGGAALCSVAAEYADIGMTFSYTPAAPNPAATTPSLCAASTANSSDNPGNHFLTPHAGTGGSCGGWTNGDVTITFGAGTLGLALPDTVMFEVTSNSSVSAVASVTATAPVGTPTVTRIQWASYTSDNGNPMQVERIQVVNPGGIGSITVGPAGSAVQFIDNIKYTDPSVPNTPS